LQQVVPPRSISAIASSTPSATYSGDAAQQRHRVVRVRVDQARQQHRIGALNRLFRRELPARFGDRQYGGDLAAGNGNGVIGQDHAVRFDRHHPTGFDQQIARELGGIGRHISIARHPSFSCSSSQRKLSYSSSQRKLSYSSSQRKLSYSSSQRKLSYSSSQRFLTAEWLVKLGSMLRTTGSQLSLG
jgi:hypothetical protein